MRAESSKQGCPTLCIRDILLYWFASRDFNKRTGVKVKPLSNRFLIFAVSKASLIFAVFEEKILCFKSY